jgi:hypothetical protein
LKQSQQQQQQQQQQPSSLKKEPPGVSPSSSIWNKKKKKQPSGDAPSSSNNSITSTTVAASQNRKSRLRQQSQQHQTEQHNVTTSLMSSQNSQSSTNGNNLLDKRKLIKERRMLQKQRRAATSITDDGEEDVRDITPNKELQQQFSDSVQDSPGRFSKLQRMTRRKGYENVAKQRAQQNAQQLKEHHPSSAGSVTAPTHVTTASSSAVTSLMKNTTTAVFRSGTVGASSSMTSPTGTASSYHRENSPTNRTNSTHSSLRANEQVSLENPTMDDDATLTSVRRIMSQQKNAPQQNAVHISPNSLQPINSQQGIRYQSLQYSPNNRTAVVGNAHDRSYRTNPAGGLWMGEEKSDKILHQGPRVLRTASSSDYDTDGDMSKTSLQSTQRLLDGPTHSNVTTTDANEHFDNSRFSHPYHHHNIAHKGSSIHNLSAYNNSGNNSNNTHRRVDDDDRTFDYGDKDDDSNGSTSYAMRRRKEAERRARLGVDNASKGTGDGSNVGTKVDPTKAAEGGIGLEGLPTLLSKEEMEQYTKTMENPAMKLGAGVVGVATVGCIAFGPVGLLIGVAAVGLGFGVMQIPEEERKKIQTKAEKAMHNFQEKAADVSEKISSNCLNTYKDSGVADHLPQCLSVADGGEKDMESTRSENLCNAGGTIDTTVPVKRKNQPSADPSGPQVEQAPPAQTKQQNDRLRNKKVACLRNVRIMPVAQIHGLDPSVQPKAWLDVVASANTTNREKNEAMEEILLLAKDKRRAKIFMSEGILDSILWTLSRYFEKLDMAKKDTGWAFPEITAEEKTAATLAAQCCVTLGKAHCAAIHTEGDLQLMSMYERGTVPEERQVAQMLYEVPHYARITKTDDPTVVDPTKEVFAVRQLTLPQAEELSMAIKAVADGKL